MSGESHGDEGKADTTTSAQSPTNEPSEGESSRLLRKAQNHLQKALDEDDQVDKHYHIRSSLQMLTLENSERSD